MKMYFQRLVLVFALYAEKGNSLQTEETDLESNLRGVFKASELQFYDGNKFSYATDAAEIKTARLENENSLRDDINVIEQITIGGDSSQKEDESIRESTTIGQHEENPGLINSHCKLIHSKVYEEECESFCSEFMEVCVNPNYFSNSMGWDECIETCTGWPRIKAEVTRPPSNFVHLGGDTFACRDLHLWEAQVAHSPTNAAFHCYHSVADGGSICADSEVEGKSPFLHLRDGACTHHHFGYCDLSADDSVADCMRAGLDDVSLPKALKMLPSSVKILFLNDNPGITKIPSETFKQNLKNPIGLKALYFDDCNITTIDEDAFHPLENLEILSLNFNFITELKDDLLKLPELKQFSIYGDPSPPASVVPEFGPGGGRKPGRLTSNGFTAKLFQYTKKLERLIMYGNAGIIELHEGMFDGLSKVDTMFFVFCGLKNEGIPPGVFEPLVSMKYFDFQGNQFKYLDPSWFGEWSENIERLVFFLNDIGPITDVYIFKDMPNLKQVYLDNNPRLDGLTPEFFENNKKFETLTL